MPDLQLPYQQRELSLPLGYSLVLAHFSIPQRTQG